MSEPRRAAWLDVAWLAAIGFLIYANALGGGYCYDDTFIIRDNAALESISGMRHLFTKEFGPVFRDLNYRPGSIITFYVDSLVFGKTPGVSRFINQALHVALGLALFGLWRALGVGRATAWWAAALFLAHPLQSEVVNCPAFRRDILATLAAVGVVWLIGAPARRGEPIGAGRAALAATIWWLGLLNKEIALLAIALTPLVALAPSGAGGWRAKLATWRGGGWLAPAVAFAIAFVGFLIPYATLGSDSPKGDYPGGGGPALGIFNFCKALTLFARLWVAPIGLSVGHWFEPTTTFADPRGWVGAALLAGLVGGGFWLWRRGHWAGVGALWGAIGLAPVSQLVPTPELVAERYLYLSHAGFALALAAWLATDRPRATAPDGGWAPGGATLWPRGRWLAAAAIVLLWAGLTVDRNRDWSDDVTLNLRRYELWDNAAGDEALAAIHFREGDRDEAEFHARRAAERDPQNATARRIVGLALAQRGEFDAARDWLIDATRLNPDDPINQRALTRVEQMARRSKPDAESN